MLTPLAIEPAYKEIPVKIVSLGHRSGAMIMVRTDSSYRRLKDATGKRLTVLCRIAANLLGLRQMLVQA